MQSKKIGIVTFHTALNYGAVLQTYALQKFLNNLEIENEVIDYDCPFIRKCYSPFFISGKKVINSLIRGVAFSGKIKKKRKNFDSFLKKYICLSKKYNNINEMNRDSNHYKYFISGSDQVWSPVSANFDEFYFLPFAKKNQKYSYAASLGTSKLSEDEKIILKNRLKDFSIISVREESAKTILDELTNAEEIDVHVDPTLLLAQSDWKEMTKTLKKDDRYLLIFNVEKPIYNVEFAKKLAQQNNLKVVYINDRTLFKDKEIKYVEAPTPNDFISLFANADMIVTNSFHGTVFSIIFEKEFFVEYENKKTRNIRSEALLKKLNINHREITSVEIATNYDKINWKKVNKVLEEERKKAREYLLKINKG